MTDPISSQVGSKMLEQAFQKDGAAAPKAPEADDVARFEKAMQGDVQGAEGPEAPSGVQETQPQGPVNLGDAILDGVEKLREGIDNKTVKIEKILNKEGGQPLTIQETMQLQYELMQLNLQQDVTTKSADKTSQGVQTLFRNQ